MASTDKRKQSLYFPDDMLNEISKEAIRLDRSLSWMVQQAWRIASEEVARFPSVDIAAPEAALVTPRDWAAPEPEIQHISAPTHEPGSQVRDFLRGKFENT